MHVRIVSLEMLENEVHVVATQKKVSMAPVIETHSWWQIVSILPKYTYLITFGEASTTFILF